MYMYKLNNVREAPKATQQTPFLLACRKTTLASSQFYLDACIMELENRIDMAHQQRPSESARHVKI